MKKTIINIYHDPATEIDLEGRAELLEFIKADTLYSYFRVRFLIDGYKCIRKIRRLNFLDLGN